MAEPSWVSDKKNLEHIKRSLFDTQKLQPWPCLDYSEVIQAKNIDVPNHVWFCLVKRAAAEWALENDEPEKDEPDKETSSASSSRKGETDTVSSLVCGLALVKICTSPSISVHTSPIILGLYMENQPL